jgi:hypothetical protein
MRAPIARFSHYVKEETELLRLVVTTLHMASRQEELAIALYNLDALVTDEPALDTLAARRDEQIAFAEAAQKEVGRGFSRLCAHTTVAIWGALEVLLEDILVAALLTDISKADQTRLDRVRLPFGQFERVDRDERVRAAVGQVLQNEGISLGGITRLENALAIVSLSGPVDEAVGRTIWELQNVRNVIVHRGSVADQRLIDRCPWLSIEPGDEVVISLPRVFEYATAAVNYASTLADRIDDQYGAANSKSQTAREKRLS